MVKSTLRSDGEEAAEPADRLTPCLFLALHCELPLVSAVRIPLEELD
jgi:hypothetical protein